MSESREKEAVPVPVFVEPEKIISNCFRLPIPAGFNILGIFNFKSDLETFLSRFENCSEYFGWNEKDKLFQLKNSLIEAAGFIVGEIGPGAKLCEIIQLLKLRFGNENQMERFRAELKSRRRKPGESLQHLFQDVCRLKTLAFGKTAESDFLKLYLRDVFLDSMNDRKLRKLILIQEPSTMEEALRVANHLEVIDATESNDSDREYSSHTTRKKVRNLDVVSEPVTSAKDGTEMEKQLAEMKRTLDDVRQELSRQVTLTSNNQTRDMAAMATTSIRNESALNHSSVRRRKAPAEHFVGSSKVVGNDTCRYCKEVGHWVENCPKLRQKYWNADTCTRDVTQRKFNVDDRNETQVLNSPSKNKCRSEAYLEIRLRTRKMCALLDTECDHSVIGRSIIPNAVMQPTNERLYTADGAELPLLGGIKLNFRVQKTWTSVLVVVSEAINDLILGIDWLTENKCVWDLGNRTFEVKGTSGTLHDKQSRKSVRRLYVDNETVVPAKGQMHVPARTIFPSFTASGVWAVTPKAINQDTVVASGLHDGSDLNTVVRIVNLNGKPRKFRKSNFITEAESVEICEDDSCEVGVGTFHNEAVDPLNSANMFSDIDLDAENRFMGIQKAEDDTKHLESMLKNIGQSLSEQQTREVVEFLKKNSDVFAKSEFDLGRTGLVKHVIDTGENEPFKQQLRRHPMAHLPVIDEHVDKMLRNGIIEPSSSP